MKRRELIVGEQLYCATPTDWRNGWEGYRTGKAKVLAVEPHKKSVGDWGFAATFTKVAKGNGVLVEIGGHKDVVPLAHLRGTYEDGVRHMQEVQKAASARHEEEQRDYESRRAVAEALVARASSLGVTVIHDGAGLKVWPDGLDRLLILAGDAEDGA